MCRRHAPRRRTSPSCRRTPYPAFHRIRPTEHGVTDVREPGSRLATLRSFQVAPTSFAFTILLGLYAALPALSIDLSAPTLPLLPQALQTTVTLAGLTLSLFMVGFALGQLSAGNFSDARGRRPGTAGRTGMLHPVGDCLLTVAIRPRIAGFEVRARFRRRILCGHIVCDGAGLLRRRSRTRKKIVCNDGSLRRARYWHRRWVRSWWVSSAGAPYMWCLR